MKSHAKRLLSILGIVRERGHSYGPPSVNHGCTAALWSAYISRHCNVKVELDAHDVCNLNVLQKVSRDAHTRKPDNDDDIIGFIVNKWECGK